MCNVQLSRQKKKKQTSENMTMRFFANSHLLTRFFVHSCIRCEASAFVLQSHIPDSFPYKMLYLGRLSSIIEDFFVPLQSLRRSRRDSLAALKQAARLYYELDYLVCCRTM